MEVQPVMRTAPQPDAAGSKLDLAACEDALREQARRLVGPRLRRLVAPSDLFQDTMVIAVRRFAEVSRMPPRRAMAWLTRAMRFRLMRHLRDARAELRGAESRSGPVPHPRACSTPILSRLARRELQSVLLARIDELGEQDRRVLRWIYLDRLDFAAIAERLGRSESAVRGLHHRAIRRLRALLETKSR